MTTGDAYDGPERIVAVGASLAARIDGNDGRIGWVSSEDWPAPDLHYPILHAFVHTTGPTTTRKSSINTVAVKWQYPHFLSFLAERLGPTVQVTDITDADIAAYVDATSAIASRYMAVLELRRTTFAWWELGYTDRSLFEAASQWVPRPELSPTAGYDPGVYQRIVRQATTDVEAIIARHRAGRELMQRHGAADASLTSDERILGSIMAEAAVTGQVRAAGANSNGDSFQVTAARSLFVTRIDMTPLMILLAARTGRNLETLKELSAEHTIREGASLVTQTIKRRQGFEASSVEWEIGGRNSALRTAGGVYLTALELCRRSREFAGSDKLLCLWIKRGPGGTHKYPWAHQLGNQVIPEPARWVRDHDLRENDEPLQLTFPRIKTTVDRDRMKKEGQDLDRAAVTNTPEVLYRHYIAPDPTARKALTSITRDVLVDLQRKYTAEHPEAAAVPLSQRPALTADEPDPVSTAFLTCRNILGNPEQEGVECSADFLTCFRCPNAVVADENIPTILRLAEELAAAFERLPFDVWVHRYGQAWIAIHDDILPSRSAEDLATAAAAMPASTPLTLLTEPEMF
ncbi:hypothetical protein NYQ31_11850 [Curtobacterium flaccumfaciens]|uniref:hypothetical protein n=1 Tax=Curtobacterium flaccumfaciens TaxID=2035 RepID=UPI00217E2918|nr:hypothetical protein [Curtobacterium flaccumfaciens]MCS6559093.1 hypothetical protein [Curtobacterium flaccumfaciens]